STATTANRNSASTEPCRQSGKPVPKRSTIWLPYRYTEVPPTSEGQQKSPTFGMNTNRNAANTPGTDNGSVTRRNACHRVEPRSAAASSRRRSIDSSDTKIGSATNGTQMENTTRNNAHQMYQHYR